MTPDEEKRQIARRAAAVLACSLDVVEQAALEVERETGQRVLRRRPQMSDASRGDLEELLAQVRAADEALTLALQWVGMRDRLGAVLKRMPKEAAAELAQKLREAGLNV